METRTPVISVIVPTCNRSDLLKSSLESLTNQSVPKHRYEIVVIDDGSIDATADVCQAFSLRVRLKYFRIENSGISAAKNLGVFASGGSILLFFDDDDIADRNLIGQHIEFHEKDRDETIAALGYTTWHPPLRVSELMHYVTDVGHFLFSYRNLTDGQVLDYTYFWGGRSSCKRSLLANNGIFNQEFRFGCEDIELGYRLSKLGLKVIFNRNAVQYMNRPLTYEEFCRRCEKQGTSQYTFSQLHPQPEVQQYCQVIDAEAKWRDLEQRLDGKVSRVHEIERRLESRPNNDRRRMLLDELWALYKWTFNAFKTKGIVDARALSDARETQPSNPLTVEKHLCEGAARQALCS